MFSREKSCIIDDKNDKKGENQSQRIEKLFPELMKWKSVEWVEFCPTTTTKSWRMVDPLPSFIFLVTSLISIFASSSTERQERKDSTNWFVYFKWLQGKNNLNRKIPFSPFKENEGKNLLQVMCFSCMCDGQVIDMW